MDYSFEDSPFLDLRHRLRAVRADHVESGPGQRAEIEVRTGKRGGFGLQEEKRKPLLQRVLIPEHMFEIRTEGLNVQQCLVHVENNNPGH